MVVGLEFLTGIPIILVFVLMKFQKEAEVVYSTNVGIKMERE